MIYALSALFVGFLVVFGMCLIALARIGKMLKISDNLDWDQIAAMTGDIGALKKSVQRLNNRINGMEAQNPAALIQALSSNELQNVTPITSQQQIKGG